MTQLSPPASPMVPAPGRDTTNWQKIVAPYKIPDTRRSLWQIANTLIPYFLLWILMILASTISFWLTLPLVILAAGFLVRTFIIFHDCGHGAFFKERRRNEIVGFITGLLTFTPYFHWRHEHAVHHSSSGDLDRRGAGDIWMMTVQEYLAASPRQRFIYRVYRHPIFLFIVSPIILFLFLQRIPYKSMRPRERRSIWLTNVALLFGILAMGLLVGFGTFLALQVAVMWIAASTGVWLFYVQHQYEDVYWQRHEEWDYATAAVEGSSFYKLPRLLQWFTGNIGYHHIHHLSPRIPNYNLERCHNENPMFQIEPVTLRQSLGCMRYRLWDEENMRLIDWREFREMDVVEKPAGALPSLLPKERVDQAV